MSGRAGLQQGLAATCEDRGTERERRPTEHPGLAHESVGAKTVG